MTNLSYKNAGVDLEQYQESMRRLPKLLQRTKTPRVLPWADGFAGLFQLNDPREANKNYRDPVMVSGTDGVGTKLKLATMTNRHDTVGIDLVAMCVNDVICAGAQPLFFLDYVAMGKDDSDLLEQIVKGISDGCVQAHCALIGGETAIMPDLYQAADYDLAGFCVGVVERDHIIDGSKIQAGDAVIGLASSGFHSNGFSLIRKTVFEHAGLSVDDLVVETKQSVGDTLLKPTQIYADVMQRIAAAFDLLASVHGIAHITGGGLIENVERILPNNVDAVLERTSWALPAEFTWLQQLGSIEDHEMYHVFNMGIGLALIADQASVARLMSVIADAGIPHWQIGTTTAGAGNVQGIPANHAK